MNIIPMPLEEKELSGKIFLSKNTIVSGDAVNTIAMVNAYIKSLPGSDANTLSILLDASMKTEQYSITCDGSDIIIHAGDEAGAFYAFQTLVQVFAGKVRASAVAIKDEPKYSHRGFMLDSARHFWSVDKVKQFLDVMANIKMNRFHWHLTDDQGWRIEIKKYPLLATKGSVRSSTPLTLKGYNMKTEPRDNKPYGEGCYYTQDELRDVVAYAKARHIEIIPEVDMPGHMVAAIACYPELSCTGEPTEVSNRWGVMDNILCCGKQEVFDFATDIIDEVLDIFPFKYFHIGGDEVPKDRWKKCPLCQKKIKELGLKDENALQGYFNNYIANYLKSKGRSLIGWNEILDGASEFDKDVIPQWWVHRKGDKNEREWLAGGGKVMLSMCDYIYMDHSYSMRPLKKTYSFSASKLAVSDDQVVGMEIPQWTEYIRDEYKLDMMTFPRLLTFAEVCWTSENRKDYKDFENRLEAMRDYFVGTLRFELPHQKVYRGKAKPLVVLNPYLFWAYHPYYEVEQNKMLMKK